MKEIIMAIDLGSINVSCVIAEVYEGVPKVLGVGFSKSQGIRKGAITNIEHAARSVKAAVSDAKLMSGQEVSRAIISISGVYVKSRNSSNVISIAGGEIGHKEIHRVVNGALHNADIPSEYEAIHVLPYHFMVDDQEYVDDPIGMSGSRLKAMVHIVTAQKTALDNLRRVIKATGIEIDSIVLSSYAASIAVLNEDEKELDAVCIDMGGETCDVMIYSGNSMCYDSVLSVGSNHITKDIAHACNASTNVAEDVKLRYIDITKIYEGDNSQTLEISTIGGERTQQVSCAFLCEVVFARLKETLGLLYGMLDRNEMKNQLAGGIVFTGGLTRLKGIDDLIAAFFKDYSTRLALPQEIEGMPKELKDPTCSVVVGLVLYGAGRFTNYEMDCQKRLKTRRSKLFQEAEARPINVENEKNGIDLFKDDLMQEPMDNEENKPSFLSRVVNKIAKSF